jgi:soluble lytic murein transglycosylase-like protein
MKKLFSLVWLTAIAVVPLTQPAHAQRAEYDALIVSQARASGVPEALVHRVIVRESRYQAHLVGRGGTIGLMQIKLATARGLGYSGDAAGLRDPATNLTYGIKYLAGAWQAANGDHGRAVRYYASGYYYAAKRQRAERVAVQRFDHIGVPAAAVSRRAVAIKNPADAQAQQVPEPQAGANAPKPR